MKSNTYIAKIFDVLRNGGFISENSNQYEQKQLYKYLEEEDNFEDIAHYFAQINLELKINRGRGYVYFARNEVKKDLKEKLSNFLPYIDILAFFSLFDSNFGVGTRFSIGEIEDKCKINAELRDLLNKISAEDKNTKEDTTINDKVKRLIEKFENKKFLECEDKERLDYKVLSAYDYLLELIDMINLPEDDQATP